MVQAMENFNSEEIRAGILAEITDLKTTAQSFGPDAIKSGSWFNQFLGACLKGYQERILEKGGEAYLRGKYPGLPTEAIAGKLCELAEQTAAIAGGISGAAASGAVLTAGAGIPMALTAVMAEVLFTIRLQLRLVYDLHLLYGISLDASDPEDLLGLFAVVYGIKVAEVGGIGAKALGPEVMRAQIYRLIHGNTKAIQGAVNRILGPRIARSVTQKGILKTAVPVVGVALSAGWNYAATKTMGSRVRQDMRIQAGLREQAYHLHSKLSTDESTALAMVEGLLALAISDDDFSDRERDVYIAFLKQMNLGNDQLEMMADKIDVDLDGVLSRLNSLKDSACSEAIAHCFCLIAAADGFMEPKEKELLKQLLTALAQEHQMERAEELCEKFRKEQRGLGKAVGYVGDAVGNAAGTAKEAMGSAMGWMKQRLKNPEQTSKAVEKIGLEADSVELETEAIVNGFSELNMQFAEGIVNLDQYQSRLAELESQIKSDNCG